MTALNHTKTLPMHSWFGAIASIVHGTFGDDRRASSDMDDGHKADLSEQTDELINQIDHGYLIEETGERAEVPRFARSYFKSAIANGDA